MHQQEGSFFVYRASAGSGKTYTLAKEYLSLALLPPDDEYEGSNPPFNSRYFRHILAITFTNDAANEMKSRILDKLRDFQTEGAKDSMFIEILEKAQKRFGKSFTEKKLLSRSEKLLFQMLHSYSDISISTIDSFTRRIVQSFTQELNLPFRFDVEASHEESLEEAAGRLMDTFGRKKDKFLDKRLTEFALPKGQKNDFDRNVSDKIINFGNTFFQETHLPFIRNAEKLSDEDLERLISTVRDKISEIDKTIPEIRKEASYMLNLLERSEWTIDRFPYKEKGWAGYFINIFRAEAESIFSEKCAPGKRIINTLKDDSWFTKANKKKFDAAFEVHKAPLRKAFERIERIREDHGSKYQTYRLIEKELFLIVFVGRLRRLINELKEEQNFVFISDFGILLRDIVEQQPVPFIFERIGERYKHLLIDEFQDTSGTQWLNLVPLLSNALAESRFCLVVGDPKQSVYRWRGGNPDLLVNLPNIGEEASKLPSADAQIFKFQHEERSLSTNWRSLTNIIEFNNEFFDFFKNECAELYPEKVNSTDSETNEEPSLIRKFYEGGAQEHRNKAGGEVIFSFLKRESRKKDPNLLPPEELMLKTTESYIRKQLEDGYSLSDIVLLVRKNKKGTLLAEHLMRNGIPVISNESLKLESSGAVRLIIGFFRLLKNSDNPSEKFEILYFLYEYFSDEESLPGQLVPPEEHQEISKTAQKSDLISFTEYIRERFGIFVRVQTLRYLSLYDMSEMLIRAFDFQNDAYEQIFLQKFLDIVHEKARKKGNNTVDFLDYWDKKKDSLSVSSPKGAEAVRIITIHKSKGLEFPVVIMPFADWGIYPSGGFRKNYIPVTLRRGQGEELYNAPLDHLLLNFSKNMEGTLFENDYLKERENLLLDSLNMIYVAFTRASERLLVLTPFSASSNAAKKNLDECKRTAELLRYFAQRQAPEAFNTDEHTVEITLREDTERDIKPHKNDSEREVRRIESFISSDIRDKLRMRANSGREDLDLSPEQLIVANNNDPQRRGILMHYSLEHILTHDDLKTIGERLYREGYILREHITEWEDIISKIVHLPEIREYYEPGNGYRTLNEHPLFDADSGKSYRVDRLMTKGADTVLIEFKTGQKADTDLQQVRNYLHIISKQKRNIADAFVVYTDDCKVIRVKSQNQFLNNS